MIRFNYSHSTSCRLRAFPSGLGIWMLFEYSQNSERDNIQDSISIEEKSLVLTLQRLGDSLLKAKKDGWEGEQPSHIEFQLNKPRNLTETDLIQAINIIEEELIESGTRCHYLYNLDINTLGIPPNSIPGFSAEVFSEVFGEINTAMEESLYLSIINLSRFLMDSRTNRWENE